MASPRESSRESKWLAAARHRAYDLCEKRMECAFDIYKPGKYEHEWKIYGLALRETLKQLQSTPGIAAREDEEAVEDELDRVDRWVDVTGMSCRELRKSL